MHLAHYLGLLHRSLNELARGLREVADAHRDEHDVAQTCERLGSDCASDAARIAPFAERYGEEAPEEPERLHTALFHGPREGGLALLRDLQDAYLLAAECDIAWSMVVQAAQGVRDRDLYALAAEGEASASARMHWLRSRMKQAAPQALLVA